MASLETMAASAGLGPLGSLGPMLIGVLLIFIVVKILSMPFKLVWNGLLGALCLWLVNMAGVFFDFHIKITIAKALIAGFFGIPGTLAVILFEFFGK